MYKVNASATFGVSVSQVNKDQRQIGKVQELACGFAGGVGAFAAMGRVYGVNLSDAQSQAMVGEWRAANRWAVSFWSDLERAFTDAYAALNVLPPTYEPRATGHITQMIGLMQKLIDNGSAYALENGDLYLEVRKLKEYLTLSNQRRNIRT